MQYWSCFTQSSSSSRLRSNSNCKYSPCCCVNQEGSTNFRRKEVTLMKFALKASGEKKIKNMKCKFTTFAKMTSGLKLQWTKNQSVRSPWFQWSDKKRNSKYEVGSFKVRAAVRLLSLSKFSLEVSSKMKFAKPQKWSAMAILSYPEVFKTVTGSAAEKYMHTCEEWNSTFVHIQYEGNQHGQRDRWSQVPWGVCEVPPLWCILSSHRMDSKLFQISSWLKQHPSNKFLDEKRSKFSSSLEVPNLVAIDLPAVLSVWIWMFTIFGKLGF